MSSLSEIRAEIDEMTANSIKFGNYFDEILKISMPYLKKQFSSAEIQELLNSLRDFKGKSIQEYVDYFDKVYCQMVKRQYQMKTSPNYDKDLCKFIEDQDSQIKIVWGDCLHVLKRMKSESVHLIVTSPLIIMRENMLNGII